LKHQTNVIFRP